MLNEIEQVPEQTKWDAIADIWHFFEENGLTSIQLKKLMPLISIPTAVIGCGLGMLLKPLVAEFGHDHVHGYDASPGMVKIARQKGMRNVYCCDPKCPISNDVKYGSIIVATGVVDSLSKPAMMDLLKELTFSLAANGKLILTAFVKESDRYAILKDLGVASNGLVQLKKLFSLAASYRDSKAGVVKSEDRRKNLQQHILLAKIINNLEKVTKFKNSSFVEAAELLIESLTDHEICYSVGALRGVFEALNYHIVAEQKDQNKGVHIIAGTQNPEACYLIKPNYSGGWL